MSHDLPPGLRAALAGLAEGQGLNDLKRHHGAVSGHYRAGGASAGIIGSEAAALAYALARLPATYAACRSALAALDEAWDGPAFDSVLDIGCGPGTALLAAQAQFPDIGTLTGLDHNPAFLALARRLLGLMTGGRGDFQLIHGDFSQGIAAAPADLVMASYALVELEPGAVPDAAMRAWTLARQVLVLVEPGTPAGFQRIRAARTRLVDAGAHFLAPCPHEQACPLAGDDWCHFSVRLARSRAHRHLKGAEVPFEDERFSYLVAARAPVAGVRPARILAPPQHLKGSSRFRLCGPEGIETVEIPSRAPAHKRLKKLEWGDFLAKDRN